jgi:LDH2 family malate/lactate/ureidoglycolate dehydrogenase
MTDDRRIDPQRLLTFSAAVYAGAGVPEADAQLIADTLVQADLWGHQSHGVLRLGWYLERLRRGVMQAVTRPELVVDAGGLAVIDGHDGIGQVLTTYATKEVVRRARQHGVAAVAVRNSNHFGTCMYYTCMGAEAGCLTYLCSNGGPAMAPWGGRKKIIGTNPWSFAAPAGRHPPIVSDMANTGVARGKIYLARNRGETIPPGWAMDVEGRPTTDPDKAIEGIILPMAGHKGYAIAAMIDVMAGVLTGSQFLASVNGPYKYDRKSGAGHFLIAVDIAKTQPITDYNKRIEQFIAELKSVPLAADTQEIFYPGEIEARNDVKNRAEGLSLPDGTLEDLFRIAKETGVPAEFSA